VVHRALVNDRTQAAVESAGIDTQQAAA